MSEKDQRNSESKSWNAPQASPKKDDAQGAITFMRKVFRNQTQEICTMVERNSNTPYESIEHTSDQPQVYFDRAYGCMINEEVTSVAQELDRAFSLLNPNLQHFWNSIKEQCSYSKISGAKLTSAILHMALVDTGVPVKAATCVIDIVQYYIDQTGGSVN